MDKHETTPFLSCTCLLVQAHLTAHELDPQVFYIANQVFITGLLANAPRHDGCVLIVIPHSSAEMVNKALDMSV